MSSFQQPLVSIVTPSHNTPSFLAGTIESIVGQNYPHIEYIVVDGGSTDETLSILERYRGRLSYSSTPDHGPADALCQGFKRARGDIFAWVSADDQLVPGAVRKAVEFLQQQPHVDVVYGVGEWIDENGAVIGRYPTAPFDARLLERECFICQPTVFVRASAYRRCELDPSVDYSFDYDLWIRMAKAGACFAFLNENLAYSRMHGGAKTIHERRQVFNSSMSVLKRHYQYVPFAWIFGYTAFRIDRRDQFFQPLKPTLFKYLASLPVGIWYNRRHPFRFTGEWFRKPFGVLAQRRNQRRAEKLLGTVKRGAQFPAP